MFKIFNIKTFKINFSWIFFDKLFRGSLNILLSIILARYLGPKDFGILNYLLALLFLFNILASFGINPILVNKIIKAKSDEDSLIINSYYFRLITSLFNFFLFILIIYFFNKNDLYFTYSLILGLSLIFKSYEVLVSYFEAKSLLKYIVISQLFGFISSLAIVTYIIYNNLDNKLLYFALTLDFIIVFFFINFFYFRKKNKFFLRFSFLEIKKLISQSLPILVTSLSIYLYMRIDQIMINELLDEYNLGIYSVSVRYIEIFHFIPKIIMISYLPIILKSKKYNSELLKLNSLLFKISLFIVVFLFISSKYIIPFIFGKFYIDSVLTTLILSFSLIFVFFGVVNEHWYVDKNYQKYYAINVLLGAITNISLNYLLIPKFGINGAAYSTLVTYFLIIFLFDIFSNKTKKLLQIKINSLKIL